MDQNTKQRLVGITVIFALAVIFLPMILDGSGVRKETLTVDIPIPFELDENPAFEQKIIELHANVDDLPTIQSGFIDEQSVSDEIAEEAVGAKQSQLESVKNKAETKPETKKVDPVEPKKKVVSKPKTQPMKTATKQKIGGETYVLQVGSFKDQAKAILQRDKLRKSKIAAVFVEKFNTGTKLSYRVRLGPFVNRELSKIAQNKVKAKYNIDGLIMKYVP